MSDIYLYDDVPVLKNKFEIKDEKTLDLIEAEQSRASMMLLYEQGIDDFSPKGLCDIHRFLFEDIYEWAGKYRIINIEKREALLGGRSVWYSNDENIADDLDQAFTAINEVHWSELSRKEFVRGLVRHFSAIWKIHPFREGNTRTVVMLLSLFAETHGYYMDHDLLATSAGYVRNSFVMASLDEYSEYEHLEKILLDAISEDPIEYGLSDLDEPEQPEPSEKYKKYQSENYVPQPHYKREN